MTVALLFARHMLGGLWGWLQHRSFWQLVSMGLCAVLLVQHFQLADARHDRDSYKRQRDELSTEIAAADAQARKAEADGKRIAKQLKDRTDEENRRIASDAGALRVQGPGKAACRPAAAASGGHDQADAKPDAAGPALPPDDSAAVPWPWLVQRAQEHDELRAEVIAWREWYQRLVAAWPKGPDANPAP